MTITIDRNVMLFCGVVVICYLVYSNMTSNEHLEVPLSPCQVDILALKDYLYANNNPSNIAIKDMPGYNASIIACKIRTNEK